tara:strand:+ start:191 stop:517 length:327 start_codon:yes stop_codon:yes gene_type:complete
MEANNIIILAIVVTSLATYISRFFGVLTSEKVSVKSNIFHWFNLVAYATLAALLARMVIFPLGVLQETDLILRIIVLFFCFIIYFISKKNLVIPTIISAIILSLLNSI